MSTQVPSSESASAQAWLGGKAAIAVLSFDVDAESPILAIGRRYAAHAMVMSHQAYGPQVGVPRILEMLADFSLKATFFIPGLTVERYPETVERIAAAGHEIGHHSYSHRTPVSLSDSEERADFERALSALERAGVRPQGHRAALWDPTYRTLDLVAEYGLQYDSSLMDDDRPYILETTKGSIAELPPHWLLDDWEQYAYLPEPNIGQNIEAPEKVFAVWSSELDAMRRYGCLFMLTNHPFVSGRPSRVENLRRLIQFALDRGDVQFLTAGEVAARAHSDPNLARRPLRAVEADPAVYPTF